MASSNCRDAAFPGYDLSGSTPPSKSHPQPSDNNTAPPIQSTPPPSQPRSNASSSDHESWFSYPSRHARPPGSAAMEPPFEVPKLWREAMQCVSINAGLYPKQILHKYYELYPTQASTHPGYVELDVWRSKRATVRGIKCVHVRHLDKEPGKIYLMVIFVDETDQATKKPIVRLVTNTSIRHVLEEPCENCPLWLKVQPGGGPQPDSPYQIVPCCERWVECADFEAPISDEEKQVPEMVSRLAQELQRKNLLLHAKEREIEAKDDQLRRLRDMAGRGAATGRLFPGYRVDLGNAEQYCWAALVVSIFMLLWALR